MAMRSSDETGKEKVDTAAKKKRKRKEEGRTRRARVCVARPLRRNDRQSEEQVGGDTAGNESQGGQDRNSSHSTESLAHHSDGIPHANLGRGQCAGKGVELAREKRAEFVMGEAARKRMALCSIKTLKAHQRPTSRPTRPPLRPARRPPHQTRHLRAAAYLSDP